MNTYPLNQIVVCEFTFEDAAGNLVDPTTAAIKITEPDAVVVDHVLADLTHVSLGVYTLQVTGSKVGRWRYEADGGNGLQVGASFFRILAP